MRTAFLGLFVLAILVVGCKKEEGPKPAPLPPSKTVDTPNQKNKLAVDDLPPPPSKN